MKPLDPPLLFSNYQAIPGTYDEIMDADGRPRQHAASAFAMFERLSTAEFAHYQSLGEVSFLNQGVTFSVYSDARGTEKIFPVCLVPRVIGAAEWRRVERGLAQRLQALSLFLDDVYGEQKILRDRVLSPEIVLGSKQYLPKLRGLRPPGAVRIHIAGVDLIRGPDGTFRVLEDNLRTPSGGLVRSGKSHGHQADFPASNSSRGNSLR